MTHTPTEADFADIAKQHVEMNAAVVRVVYAWASLENVLAMLLGNLIQGDGNRDIGLAIYYSPSNTETRLRIVKAAFDHSMLRNTDSGLLRACFKKIMANIDKSKDKRNSVVHGNVVQSGRKNHKNRIRLTPPIFSPAFAQKASLGLQWPGMAPSDVVQISDKIYSHIEDVLLLTEAIKLTRDFRENVQPVPPIGKVQRRASQEKSLQLAKRLQIEARQTVAPTPQAESNQPESNRPEADKKATRRNKDHSGKTDPEF